MPPTDQLPLYPVSGASRVRCFGVAVPVTAPTKLAGTVSTLCLFDPREDRMAVTADLDKVLDKAYEGKTLTELIDAPVAALAGVSDGDAELLKQAFGIKTVGDLGRNKYFRTAAALVDLAERAR